MEHLKQAIDQFKKLIEQTKMEQSQLMSKLTPEQMAMVAPIQADVTNALDALKKGDAESINQLQKKYADINN